MFSAADDFVCDQHIADATFDQDFGFRHLLAACADGAERHLFERNDRGFVRLGMRTQTHARITADEARHPLQVPFESVEIDQQRGRVDVGERHAQFCWRGKRHDVVSLDLSGTPSPACG